MTISIEDISFVYSGGTNNIESEKSIGGPPSINAINLSVNNLFGYVKKEDASAGTIDYRCFYLFNNNQSNAIYDSSIYIKNQIEGISSCQIGVSRATEAQVITFSRASESGSFVLAYDDYSTRPIEWDSNYIIFQKNIENALNNLDVLSGVVVDRLFINNYRIYFLGEDNFRNHTLLSLQSNSLSPSTTIQISKTTQGQPINSIAPLLATPETSPFNVTFYDANEDSKIFLGDLRPGDGVPIWVKRTTFGSVADDETNGFQIRFKGSLIKNSNQVSAGRPCFYYE